MNLKNKRILIVTYQINCAKNFLPIVEKLKRSNQIFILLVDSSYSVWKNIKKINHIKLSKKNEIKNIIKKISPDLLLTGTNAVDSIEFEFVKYSKENKIKTISFIDNWNKIKERFYFYNMQILPDKILIGDNYYRYYCKKADIPNKLLINTGFPYFQYLYEKYKIYNNKNKKNNSLLQICFFSQPLQFTTTDSINYFGFTENIVLSAIIDVLNDFSNSYKIKIKLNIKLHPRFYFESLKNIEDILKKNRINKYLDVRITNSNELTLMLKNNIITGMFSTALLEAAILNKPVIGCLFNYNKSVINFKYFNRYYLNVDTKNKFYNLLKDYYNEDREKFYKNSNNLRKLYSNSIQKTLMVIDEVLK